MKLICTNCNIQFNRKRVKPAKNRFCSIECRKTWVSNQVTLIKCSNCETLTSNPKFCSKSCAASSNNKKFPKRFLQGKCSCGKTIPSSRTYCPSCYKKLSNRDYSKITIGDLKSKRTHQQHSQVRALARKFYIISGRPQKCKICGYSTFFHVCHIKAIKNFDSNTPISVINHNSNLVALCPNHHIEFDNDLISL